VEKMVEFANKFKGKGIGVLHLSKLFINNHSIVIGEPLLISPQIEQYLTTTDTNTAYFSPEFRQYISQP
jgi:hypothetical protein